MDQRRIIEEYYRCFRERDQDPLHEILTSDFHHVSSFAEYQDREVMLRDIWPMVGQSWACELQIFGDGPEYMVRYRLDSRVRPATNMAEYIRFEGDQISEIEVFLGVQSGNSAGEPTISID